MSTASTSWVRTAWVAAIIASAAIGLVVGWIPFPRLATAPLPSVDARDEPASGVWQPEAFCVNGPPPGRFRSLQTFGSYVGGDGFVGDQTTKWYAGAGSIVVQVAGYPLLGSNRLVAEVRHVDQRLSTIPFAGENARESWRTWELELPSDAVAVRLHGVDAESGFCGWLAFTEPTRDSLAFTWSPLMLAQTVGTVALAIVLVVGPGLVCSRRRAGGLLPVLWIGPGLLIAGGLVCWALGGLLPVGIVALIWVAGTGTATVVEAVRRRVWCNWTPAEATLLALMPLCVLGAAAKAALSGGPPGELYGGVVSRTLEIGPYSDSRIPFHTVQLVANHLSPHEPEGSKYFAPWSFSHRGPLAGLATTPIVLAVHGKPPLGMPDQPWSPFDAEGFAAFRITMMALSSLAIVAVGGLLLHLAGRRAATLAATLLALSPFFWHELYFSWPKMIAATWVVGAAWLMVTGRGYLAGMALGAAYLQHGLALLSAPVLVFWSLFFLPGKRGFALRPTLFSGLGLLTVLATWYAANSGHVASAGFLQYFAWADGGPATWSTWWSSRWNSWADTFVPLYVWLFNAGHPCFNAFGATSGRFEQFFLQYWTSAPFAAGLVTVAALVPAALKAIWRKPGAATLVLIGPGVLMTVYWGAYITGMMREAGHVLFLSGWAFLAWAAADAVPGWLQRAPGLVLRGGELLFALFASTLVAGRSSFSPSWLVNDALWLVVSLGSVGGVVLIAARARQPASESLPAGGTSGAAHAPAP